MKNFILSTASLTLFLLGALPSQATSTETDPATLIASLNSKTAKIELEQKRVNKEVNSYVFTFDQKLLKIEFNEEIRVFINDKHTSTHSVVGKVSIVPELVDLKKLKIQRDLLSIICQDRKKCVNREDQITDFNVRNDKTTNRSRKLQTSMFQLSGLDQSLAEQIIKDLRGLFPLLTPPPKPADKP